MKPPKPPRGDYDPPSAYLLDSVHRLRWVSVLNTLGLTGLGFLCLVERLGWWRGSLIASVIPLVTVFLARRLP